MHLLKSAKRKFLKRNMKKALILNSDDLVDVLADYFNVSKDNIYQSACSWIVELEKENKTYGNNERN